MGHSLGAYLAFRFALAYPDKVKGIIAIDGGGPLNLLQKIRALSLVRNSVKRLGKIYSSPGHYLKEIQQSGVIKKFTPLVEDFLLYELEPVPGGKFVNSMRRDVAEKELAAMGGSLSYLRLLGNFIFKPRKTARLIKENKIDLKSVNVPVLILKAGAGNFSKKDDVLPRSALKKMTAGLSRSTVEEFENYNHYEIITEPNQHRNIAMLNFAKEVFSDA